MVQAKRPCCEMPSQLTDDVTHDAVDASFPAESDERQSKDGNSHASSAFSDGTIKCAENLFTSKYHQRDFCKQADCCNVTNNEAKKIAKQTYKFQHSWLNKRSMSFCVTTEMWWPVYDEGEGLCCLLCIKHDTSNPQNKSKVFNKEPCKRFRPEAFEDHCRMSQHKNAVSAEMLQRVSVFQRTLDERERVAEDVLSKVFTSAYWIMKEELPNHNMKSLLNLLEELGLNDLKHFLHRSQGALREIFLTIWQTVQNVFLRSMRQEEHFGLLVDNVTDISVMEQMIMFAQFYDKSCQLTKTGFLSISNLLENSPSANASTITDCIIQNMDKCGLDSKKLSSFVSDGAAVITGTTNGVAARLKQLNPQLINFHCVCHRLALACTDSLENVSYIKSVLTWLSVASYDLFTSTFYLAHFVHGCVQSVVVRTQSHTLQILRFYQVL